MIEIKNATKYFGGFKALDNINAVIKDSAIFGLIGPNGSGKSTLLKSMCGAYALDSGSIESDGQAVYENQDIKSRLIYLSDEQYFLPHSNISEMANFYRALYKGFDNALFDSLCAGFKLDTRKKINTFSKGMQKQTAVLLALSARPRYLLCDETFDGLDPVMRQFVKRLFASDTAEKGTTIVIASHNLRELEDICDHIGLLHEGGILFERELDDMKLGLHNFQCIFPDGFVPSHETFPELAIINIKTTGSVIRLTVRGGKEEALAVLKRHEPIFLESLPLTLEEIFIEEMEAIGYDFSNLIG